MGSLLTQPITEKKTEQGEGLGLRYGLSSMQGWRLEMEDAHVSRVGLPYGLDDWSFFAVFDGHAGGNAAKYASSNLLEYILRDKHLGLGEEIGPEPLDIENETDNHINEENRKISVDIETATKQESETESSPNLSQYPSNGDSSTSVPGNQMSENEASSTVGEFLERKSKHEISSSQDELKKSDIDDELTRSKVDILKEFHQEHRAAEAIRSGFFKIDQAMRITDMEMSGCTAVCALISPTHYYIANCGDSRAVLQTDTGIRFFTEDHKPYNPKERKRIIEAGGTATVRINGTLAVSRALGDFEFKKDEHRGVCQQLVSPEPEVTLIQRHQLCDEFLILACDGIWDVMNNRDICQYVRYMLMIEPDVEKICSSVLDVCLRKGSRDNMSIIIVAFEYGPKFNQIALEEDKKNDENLLKIADRLQAEHDQLSFNDFLIELKEELDQREKQIKLPPGAGIEAKYEILRKRFLENKNISEEDE